MTRNETRRSFVRTAAATAAALSTVGVASADDPETVSVSESFTTMDRDWFVRDDFQDTDSGDSPYEVQLVPESTYSSSQCVQYTIDGTYDQGTVWIETPVDIESGTAYEVDLGVSAYTEVASYNQLSSLRAYLGPDRPTRTADFPDDQESWFYTNDVVAMNVNPWETAGWGRYDRQRETPEYDTDQLYLSVGFTTNWETEFGHLVNDVEVTLTPR